jgi:hypothetical protein
MLNSFKRMFDAAPRVLAVILTIWFIVAMLSSFQRLMIN